MTKIVIAYHSGYGHTAKLAQAIETGAKNTGAETTLIDVTAIDDAGWEALDAAHGIVFGAPTYMGSLSGPFKVFMDATSKPWFAQKWKDKVAGGFTNSGSLSGDKLSSLQQLSILAAQHGMIWVGNALPKEGNEPEHVNRLGSWLGVMAQSDNKSPDETPPAGDLKTAELYGARVASIAGKLRT